MSSNSKMDPIRFEVIRNALTEATEEMAAALRRSAYSTNIKTRADFSCAYFDRDLRVVAQAFAQATHLGSLPEVVPSAVRAYGIDQLGPGDTLITNHPYLGGSHLNDFTLISPLFYEGELFGFVANIAHHVDVGGGAPGSIGAFREVYQEGIIIPPIRLAQAGEVVPDIFTLVLAQIRSKHETSGDIRAQMAANNTGIRQLSALLKRLEPAAVLTVIDQLMTYTRQRMQGELKKLPRGTFAAEGQVDTDGYTDRPVHLAAKLVIDDDGVLFDLTGSDPQRRAPVNSTFAMTFSACAYVLKCLIDPDVPVNSGFYDSVRIIAPSGTVVNCTAPFPVVGGWETQMRLTDTLFKALAAVLPDRIPAGTKGMICHSGFGGDDPRTNNYYCFVETLGGGYGARSTSDGPDAVQAHGQNTENAPVEETEINYPVRIVRYELVDDSEGPGAFRGGLGLRRDYLFSDHEVSFTLLTDRDRWGPHGLFGGLPGRKAAYKLLSEGQTSDLGSKVTVQLKIGDIVSYRTCGGGGYGAPRDRAPWRVLKDVRENKVSLERARDVYGVAIDAQAWSVDTAATDKLRAAGPV